MSDEAGILVVDADVDASAWWQRLAAGRIASTVVATAAQALASLAAAPVRLVVVDLSLPAPELDAVCRGASRIGAVLLGLAARESRATLRLALDLGCRGVVGRDDDEATLLAAICAVQRRQLDVAQQQEDYQRLKFQYEQLRQQCSLQANRHQESQETFFLDLSHMMTIISNIMDGIVFADRDGNITLMNPVAEDLLDLKSFLAIGKPLLSQTGRPELFRALAADHARMAEMKECTQTVEVHHSEQDLLYIKLITSRVLDYRGKASGVLTVLKDVTAEYKSDQLKNQYLSIVAHELRTPLTGIKTFSTMMCKGVLGKLTEQQHRVMESIREQSLRLEHQIDKLINLGHLESDDYGQDREVFQLSEFQSGLIAPFEQPARDRAIELTFHCDVDDVTVHGDRADLRRASQALIENAVKFTPDGGKVEVRIQPHQGGLRFSVRDTGIGIDPRYHRRIFEKFFQVEDPLTRHHGGAGLGLFVAAGIVEAHGDRIEVSSQLGQGADFSFMLPLWQGQGPSAGQSEPSSVTTAAHQ